jgi:hypothetical protein
MIYTMLFPVKRLRVRAGKRILQGNKYPFFPGFLDDSKDGRRDNK